MYSPIGLSVLDPDLYAVGPDRVECYASQQNLLVTAGFDATLLKDGPIEAIVDRIKLYIDKMGRDGQCMIHLNQIAAETPPEHVHASVAACHAYGRLPIAENLSDVQFDMDSKFKLSATIYGGRPLSSWLLYKIDTVLLRSNGCDCLEVMVKVALVEKATLKSRFRNIRALPNEFPGVLYSAIHTVGMGRYAGNRLETENQSVQY